MEMRKVRFRCCGCCLTMLVFWPAVVLFGALFGRPESGADDEEHAAITTLFMG